MAKIPKSKANFQLILNTSLTINLLSLLLIFIMAYKYYRLMNKTNNHTKQHTEEETKQKKLTPTINEALNDGQKRQQSRSTKREEKSIQITGKLQKDTHMVSLQMQIKQKDKEIAKRIQTQKDLQQELELEQERGRFLQDKIIKLERLAQLNDTKLPLNDHKLNDQTNSQSKIIADLKNQLQFCQKRLLVSQNAEKELRLKLHEYQKLGEYSLDHPEYLRLRQMNTRYKEIISNLQTHLLEKNQIHSNLNISFNDL